MNANSVALTVEEQEAERREAFIASLRACADFLEQHAAVTPPSYVVMSTFVNTREELIAQAKAASWAKDFNGQWFSLQKSFGRDLQLDITADRSLVCRLVVIGTHIEPAQPEREVEDTKWECDELSLLAGGAR